MQNPKGRVVAVRSGGADGQVMVEVASGVICERCASGRGCGAGLLGGDTRNRVVSAVVAPNIEVNDGDVVRISLQPRNVLQAAIIVYGYPLAGAVLGAFGAYGFGLSDIFAALAALSGLAGGLWFARVRLRNISCLREFTPIVMEKLPVTMVPD